MQPAYRQIYWNIPEHSLIYLVFTVVLVVFLYSCYHRYLLWTIGRPDKRTDKPVERIKSVLVYGFGHARLLKEPYPGVMHFFLFWAFVILFFLGAFLDFLQVFLGRHFLKGAGYLSISFLLDIVGLLAIAGIIMALVRRYVLKPSRLDSRPEDAYSLVLLLAIFTTGYLLEGLRITATGDPWIWAQPGGALFAAWSSGWPLSIKQTVHHIFWWVHGLLAMAFILYIPYSKLFHIFLGPVNQFCRSLEPKGNLVPLDLENEEIEVFGVEKIEDFTWKHLFDTEACTRCGRCQDNCPAFLSGKALSPKKLIQDLHDHFLEKAPIILAQRKASFQGNPGNNQHESAVADRTAQAILNKALIGEVIAEEALWACTTCRACMEACPIFVEHVPKVVDMRRELVLMESRFPGQAQMAFRNIENNANPWGIGRATRADWAVDVGVKTLAEVKEGVEILYWPGCAGAFDVRNRKVTAATVKLLQAAGINFAILGTEEKCCGDSARRLGNEYLFQTLARENIEIMNSYQIKKIITQCPHCFNTLKNEYPQFGGNYQVLHHTQYLAGLIKEGRLKPGRKITKIATYHDSCYLGRYNDVYREPREILNAIGLYIIEMERHRDRSFCCGAGGGRMWLEEAEGRRINVMRIEQALERKPEIIATACPFCLTMLSDGLKYKGIEDGIEVLDLAELLAHSLWNNERGR